MNAIHGASGLRLVFAWSSLLNPHEAIGGDCLLVILDYSHFGHSSEELVASGC